MEVTTSFYIVQHVRFGSKQTIPSTLRSVFGTNNWIMTFHLPSELFQMVICDVLFMSPQKALWHLLGYYPGSRELVLLVNNSSCVSHSAVSSSLTIMCELKLEV